MPIWLIDKISQYIINRHIINRYYFLAIFKIFVYFSFRIYWSFRSCLYKFNTTELCWVYLTFPNFIRCYFFSCLKRLVKTAFDLPLFKVVFIIDYVNSKNIHNFSYTSSNVLTLAFLCGGAPCATWRKRASNRGPLFMPPVMAAKRNGGKWLMGLAVDLELINSY